MKIGKYILSILIIAALFVACNEKKLNEQPLSAYQLVDTAHFKKSVMRELRVYAKKYPEAKAYILASMHWYKSNGEIPDGIGVRTIYNEVYLVCCVNSWSFEKGEFVVQNNYPSSYFMLDGKPIFLCSTTDGLVDQSLMKKQYEKMIHVTEDIGDNREYLIVHNLKDSTTTVSEKEIHSKSIRSIMKATVEPVRSSIHFVAPVIKKK